MIIPYIMENKNDPNHQPVMVIRKLKEQYYACKVLPRNISFLGSTTVVHSSLLYGQYRPTTLDSAEHPKIEQHVSLHAHPRTCIVYVECMQYVDAQICINMYDWLI